MARTWDGREIADEEPIGSSVCVRRPAADGGVELLLLHRAHHGPDYAGDWAWTSPAGCRQPGEGVYPAALRELAEEAGLVGLRPWLVDGSARWATFAIDVPADVVVELVDPEHDRFAWVSPDLVRGQVFPEVVANGQLKAAASPRGALRFRPMTEADLDLLHSWLTTPHVAAWWDRDVADPEVVRTRYVPRIRGKVSTRMWVAELDERPVGFVQDYLVAEHDSYPEPVGGVGFDYAIGDPALLGKGVGTRLIWEFCRDVLRRDYPTARSYLASPDERNAASRRLLVKCGFVEGAAIPGTAHACEAPQKVVVHTLDADFWFGSGVAGD